MVEFVHINNTNNLGDRICSPHLYFPDLGSDVVDFNEVHNRKYDHEYTIFGGGVLTEYIRTVDTGSSKKIAWGVGASSIESEIIKQERYPVNSTVLFGSRDWGVDGTDWVPCVSCMDPLFDKYRDKKPTKYMAQYGHLDFSKAGLSMYNSEESLEKVLDYFSDHKVVWAESYHGMFWSLLLNRRTIIRPYSTKFYTLPQVKYLDLEEDGFVEVVADEDFLEKCRSANLDFYKKVLNIVK